MVNLSQEIAQKSKVHFLVVPDNRNRSMNLLPNPNRFPKINFNKNKNGRFCAEIGLEL